jgi:predicted RNA-binding protein with PIN domain
MYRELLTELGHARDKLAADLIEYATCEGLQVILVFDAHFVDGVGARSEIVGPGLEVVFSAEGETADSLIERLAYQLVRQGERVYVVTSDRMEQTVVLGSGAYRITTRELISQIKRAKQRLRDEAKPLLRHDRREIASHLSEELAARLDTLRRKS